MDKRHTSGKVNSVLFVFLAVASVVFLNIGFAATSYNLTTMTVFITNTPPVLIFANVTPNPAIPGQTLTYLANITDANANTITANITYYNTTQGAQSSIIGLGFDGTWFNNNTFSLPLTAEPGTWTVNVTYTDGVVIRVNVTSFTVNSVLATAIQHTPIDFGNQTVGQTAQRAENGSAVVGIYAGTVNGFPVILNNTGNIIANYSINGTNLIGQSDNSKVIGAGNVTFNVTDTGSGSRAGKIALPSSGLATIAQSVASGNVQNVYFWIDTPNGVTQQRYTGNITFEIKG